MTTEVMAQVLTAISTVGFPIVMCLIMYYHMTDIQKSHKEEISELTKTIENNTIAINTLIAKFDERNN